MTKKTETGLERRNFLKAVGMAAVPVALAAGAVHIAAQEVVEEGTAVETPFFLAINTSYRPGMTTAAGLEKVLESICAEIPAAKTQVLELSGCVNMTAFPPVPAVADVSMVDPFDAVVKALKTPGLTGVVLGSPVYNATFTSLCKYFIERCNPLKKEGVLANKVVGFLSVGGNRNGGQELTLQNMLMSFNGHRLIHADDNAHWGATLWNQGDSIEKDEVGLKMCKALGVRMAELAKRL